MDVVFLAYLGRNYSRSGYNNYEAQEKGGLDTDLGSGSGPGSSIHILHVKLHEFVYNLLQFKG